MLLERFGALATRDWSGRRPILSECYGSGARLGLSSREQNSGMIGASDHNDPCPICGDTACCPINPLGVGQVLILCERCGMGHSAGDAIAIPRSRPIYTALWANTLARLLAPVGDVVELGIGGSAVPKPAALIALDHLEFGTDLTVAFSEALSNLQPGGLLLFEMPAVPAVHEAAALQTTGARWFASDRGLRWIVENKLGWHLIGQQLAVDGSAPIFVGVATGEFRKLTELRGTVDRIVRPDGVGNSPAERLARLQLHLLRAGNSTPGDMDHLGLLWGDVPSRETAHRLAGLWARDRRSVAELESAGVARQGAMAKVDGQLAATRTAFAALATDAAHIATELTSEIVRLRSSAGLPVTATASASVPVQDAVDSVAIAKTPELRLLDATGHRPSAAGLEDGPWPLDRPLVSIVITSFNYARFVDDAIASALAQTFPSLEVILVEGGSSDGASRLHVAAQDRCRVRVLMQGSAHRAGANRNFGISQALGKYICCLDADDMLRPTFIEKAVFILERGHFDVVSSAMEEFDQGKIVHHIMERPSLDDLLKANHVLTCAVFRRSYWDLAGGYRDTDRSVTGYVYEDWAYWVRLSALGARFYNMPLDPLLLYRIHGVSLSRGADVLTMEQQRQLVAAINADVIEPHARDRSRREAATPPFLPVDAIARRSSLEASRRPVGTRPTVLLAMPFLALGGAERLMSGVVADLTAKGWRVVVVTSIRVTPAMVDTTTWFEAHTPDIFHLPLFLPAEFWEAFLDDLIASKEVDLLWIVGSAFAYDNLRAIKSRFPEMKVVDLLFNTVGHTENNRRRSEHIDLTLVESLSVRDWLVAHGETDDRIRLVESGVDLSRLSPALRCPNLRAELVHEPDDLLVAYCGRWSVEKAPLDFIEIARRMQPVRSVRFVMTGAGPLGPQIERAIEGAGLTARHFRLLGEVEDVTRVIASADLLVIPSHLDGRPVVAMEALACGTPVLASRVGGLPILVEDGVTGWLCEPGDVDAFVARLTEAADDRAALARMSAAARRYAEDRLDGHRMYNEFEGALRGVLGQPIECADAR